MAFVIQNANGTGFKFQRDSLPVWCSMCLLKPCFVRNVLSHLVQLYTSSFRKYPEINSLFSSSNCDNKRDVIIARFSFLTNENC